MRAASGAPGDSQSYGLVTFSVPPSCNASLADPLAITTESLTSLDAFLSLEVSSQWGGGHYFPWCHTLKEDTHNKLLGFQFLLVMMLQLLTAHTQSHFSRHTHSARMTK